MDGYQQLCHEGFGYYRHHQRQADQVLFFSLFFSILRVVTGVISFLRGERLIPMLLTEIKYTQQIRIISLLLIGCDNFRSGGWKEGKRWREPDIKLNKFLVFSGTKR